MKTPLLGHVVTVLTGQVYSVTGDSMSPSFEPGDYLLVRRVGRNKAMPARGSGVIVRDPRQPDRRYLKRLVGLPDEELALCDGALLINGDRLAEPYLGGLPQSLGLDSVARRLGLDEFFVMGDNRAHSTDSRHFGPVRAALIEGEVWFRCWPLSRWGPIVGGYQAST